MPANKDLWHKALTEQHSNTKQPPVIQGGTMIQVSMNGQRITL